MGKRQRKKDKNMMEVDGDKSTAASSKAPSSAVMDTSEVVVDALGQTAKVGGVQKGQVKKMKGKKMGQVRKRVTVRKEKAMEKALSIMERTEAKTQKFKAKVERVKTLKTLY
ncbi:hypothetical protein CBR_g40380 [Chara braunii]|uniref:Uncharacterized protein n=1 Tax=Chara braunii TaxID=69332 RepID=A0A388LTL2_CHABU|nr:hypothetical protein CBR_g40380 [Chara braunii]|eukprot:GBG85650.1 hypothetical protein CBR_g40380 [Chara braunii]